MEMSEDDRKLTYKQRRGLAVLLASKSILEAAEKLNCNEKTLRRWLALPAFQDALERAESELFGLAARRLITGTGDALQVLSEVMARQGDIPQRRQAADSWIKHAVRLYEIHELDKRLTALEEGNNYDRQITNSTT